MHRQTRFKNLFRSTTEHRWSGCIPDKRNQCMDLDGKMLDISKPFSEEEIKACVWGVILTVILSGLIIILTRITSETRPVGDLSISSPSKV